jgi:hypothetical protein
MADSPRGSWLNPLNRMIWQQTFRAKKKRMTLRDGSTFNVFYDFKGKIGMVWVSPENGFVPCGWFEYKKVVDPDWIKA